MAQSAQAASALYEVPVAAIANRAGPETQRLAAGAEPRALATWNNVPLDAVLLTLSALAAIRSPGDAGTTLIDVAVTFMLGLYWLVALLARQRPASYGPRLFRVQLSLVLGTIVLLVLIPTMVAIGNRHGTAPYRDIHDSALQIELATQRLLHGQDYYSMTYFHTPLAQWWPVGPPNPALYHTDSLPFQEELTVPFMLGADALLGWFDERFIYLAALGAVLALALILARTPATRLALVAGLGLNPLFVPSFIAGQNDVLVLAEVMGVIALARAGRRRPALLLIGAALATKETTLFFMPFLLLWLAGQDGLPSGGPLRAIDLRAWSRWLLAALGWVALPLGLFVGPFVLWNAQALLDSTIGFVEGTVPHSFPIRGLEGYGFATFVLFGRLVRSSASYWPFGLAQLAVAGPVALGLLIRQWRDNSLSRAVAGYATTLLLAYYFGRFFHASFIAFTLSLVLVAFFMDPQTRTRGTGARPARTHLSLDFLLLLLVAPESLARPDTRNLAIIAAVTMGLLVLYALVDAAMDGWRPGHGAAREGWREARNWRLRLGLVLAIIGVEVVWPEWYGVIARHAAQPWNYVHDVAMQVEQAMIFLTRGQDFYAQTYLHTPMVHWYSSPAISAALYHTDRTPFGIVGSLPFYWLAHATIGWYDQRFVYLGCLALCIALLLRLPAPRELRLAALVSIVLNPFFVPTLVYGEDDVLVLALLLLCGQALYRGRVRQAELFIGLACATKHTALFMLPPFLLYVLAQQPAAATWKERALWAWRMAWPVLVVPALLCAPFVLWDARAFFDGNVGFLAGTVPHSYPIRGVGTYGFSAVVLLDGLVRSANAYFPFTLWELGAALPLCAVLGRQLWRRPSVQMLYAAYAVLLFACYFFSRFFQDSGLAFACVALALAALLPRAEVT